ncbi:MAG: CapA family protein, partial [Firmicutes bacterium]|nr:CapA family protein [Bacillota bacterium]
VEVNLSRDEDGNVFIANHGYYPFVGNHTTDRMTVAVDEKAEQGTLEKQLSLEESVLRVKKNVGINDDFKCLAKVDSKAIAIAEGNVSDLQRKYEVQPVDIGKKKHGVGAKIAEEYVRNSETGMYCRGFDQGEREARIFCTGLIEYDFVLENIAKCFGGYEFRKMFKPVSESFAEADFVIGNLSTMMCADYPSICEVTKEDREKGYSNCREEYLGALKDAGFTALAAANPYNAVLGISGVVDTEAAIQKNQMISSGLGYEKNPIVDINGIKVGILSITTDCFHVRNTLTDEAVAKFLNVYDENRVEDEVEDLKERGAEFVLAYVHCGVGDNKLNQKGRSEVAERVAEAGADYVICTIPRVISEYYQFTTSDDRIVPIVTSLGSFVGGKCPAEGFDGAMLLLYVRKTFDGTIEVDDKYLPLKVCKYHNSREIVPVLSYLNDSDDDRDDEDDEEDLNDFIGTERAVAEKLGEGIKRSKKRLIKVADQYTNTLTMEDIYKILKKEPSKKDLEVFGDKYQKPVPCVALRKRYMREGGVAVMYKFGNFGENAPITWDIEECLEAGVSLVIDNEPHDELPCIVVEEPLMDVFALLSKTVRDWYHPVTVGVTGSMGKTTTKELMTCVFETHYQTACGQGNSNAIYQIGQLIQQLEYDDEAYIQEVHGGTQDTASFTSKVISPDICVITNIVKNHMSQIGTIENLIKNKLEITAGMKENGVLILCHDNEYLKDVKPPVRTIRYSVMDETCHYYARNIKDEGAQISFQIVSNESEFDKAGVYDAKLNIRGVHNVSNALAVFATARQAGIPPHKIIAGLSRYRSTGIRQNVFDHGGVKMLLDAYNSNPKALMAMMEVFDQLEPAEDGRKLLVLGMMGEQGDDSPQIHYDTGKAICQYDFDKLFCFGEDAKYLVQAAKECGREAYYFEDRETFNHVICANVRPGDVVVVKGSHSIALDTETMVPIFGNTIRKY